MNKIQLQGHSVYAVLSLLIAVRLDSYSSKKSDYAFLKHSMIVLII